MNKIVSIEEKKEEVSKEANQTLLFIYEAIISIKNINDTSLIISSLKPTYVSQILLHS